MNLRFDDVHFAYRHGNVFRPATRRVFEGFTIEFEDGPIVILGPNGAGKSTLLALGATAFLPDRGRVLLGDSDSAVGRDRTAMRRAIGWMPQSVRPVPGLTSREQVAYAGWLKGMPRTEAWEDAASAMDRVGLGDHLDVPMTELSGGQQRRVALAQVLVHRASIVLLDEPSVGLDPAERARFRDLLKQLSGSVSVVVSTHQVDDLNDFFRSVIVLDHGRAAFVGSTERFFGLGGTAGGSPERAAEAAYMRVIGQAP